MLVVVVYDVNTEDSEGERRLRRVAKACMNKGQRVQASVFECLLNGAEFESLKHELESMIDKDKDSVRFYNLGHNYDKRINAVGRDATYSPEGLLML